MTSHTTPHHTTRTTHVGDLTRFPSGIKWLADQLHNRSLKLGLYGCVGVRTCLGFPGQFEHEYQDAQTIADWGVDWWKHDNCWQKWATIDTCVLVSLFRGRKLG
jgi:hypothetical protein